MTLILIVVGIILLTTVLLQGIKRIEHGIDKRKTYADLPIEQTTHLPIPLGAATCTHVWDTVTKETIETEYEKVHVLVLTCPKCGLVDKTIETCHASCQHDWHRTTTQITPSAWEISKKHSSSSYRDPRTGSPWEFHQKTILVDTCKNCGERHEIIAENFDLELAEKVEMDRAEVRKIEAKAKKEERELKKQEAADLRKVKEAEAEIKKADIEANEQELTLLRVKAKLAGVDLEEDEKSRKRR